MRRPFKFVSYICVCIHACRSCKYLSHNVLSLHYVISLVAVPGLRVPGHLIKLSYKNKALNALAPLPPAPAGASALLSLRRDCLLTVASAVCCGVCILHPLLCILNKTYPGPFLAIFHLKRLYKKTFLKSHLHWVSPHC